MAPPFRQALAGPVTGTSFRQVAIPADDFHGIAVSFGSTCRLWWPVPGVVGVQMSDDHRLSG